MKAPSAKPQIYRTGLTAKAIALSALPTACALVLFYFGLDAARKFSPADPARIPFAGIPLLIALIMVAVVALTLNHFLNREVTIEDDYLVYKDSKAELHLEMAKMAYSPPAEGGLFRMLMFSDGETFVQIPAMFLGDASFSELHETISKSRRKARTERNSTYSL